MALDAVYYHAVLFYCQIHITVC